MKSKKNKINKMLNKLKINLRKSIKNKFVTYYINSFVIASFYFLYFHLHCSNQIIR